MVVDVGGEESRVHPWADLQATIGIEIAALLLLVQAVALKAACLGRHQAVEAAHHLAQRHAALALAMAAELEQQLMGCAVARGRRGAVADQQRT